MLAHALAEIRLHPGRYVSTILAIAISIAFLAGAPVLVSTQGQAEGMKRSASLAQADAQVTGTDEAIATRLQSAPGVASSYPARTWSGVIRDRNNDYTILSLVQLPPESLRWSRVGTGILPAAKDEVVLDQTTMTNLNLTVGQTFQTRDGTQLKLVGVLTGPESAGANGFVTAAFFPKTDPGTWIFTAKPGVTPATLAGQLKTAANNPEVKVLTGDEARKAAINSATADVQAFTYLLWGFAAVALVVGMITVANTFTITLAQRRRQIGLLRAVGASGRQLRARFAWEALLLGVIGSLVGAGLGIGIAAIVAAVLQSLSWGLLIPWLEVGMAVLIGIGATLAASWVPIVTSTKVAPLEALQPVATGDQVRKASLVRAVICGGLVLLGSAAVVVCFFAGEASFFVAIAAGALLALGVLFGSPLFVPGLLKISGRGLRAAGPVAKLAADNAERNPRRAAATATALMLAIGLMVTLQVATASVRATTLGELQHRFPVDLAVAWTDKDGAPSSMTDADRQRLTEMPGVQSGVGLAATPATVGNGQHLTLLGYDPMIAGVAAESSAVADDQLLVYPGTLTTKEKTVTVKGSLGSATLTIVRSRLLGENQGMVSAATLAKLGKPVPAAVFWLSIPDRNRAVPVFAQAMDIVGDAGRVEGAIVASAQLEKVIDVLLAITTGLLGVAVLIALIGVSNTLGLSVMERNRESALLRALGLQARSLRVMLMIEAIQVALVGVIVGVVAGGFFGWLAITSLARSTDLGDVRFAVDVPQTLAMVAVAVVAAALASVLPGRKAAKASPTEALAEV